MTRQEVAQELVNLRHLKAQIEDREKQLQQLLLHENKVKAGTTLTVDGGKVTVKHEATRRRVDQEAAQVIVPATLHPRFTRFSITADEVEALGTAGVLDDEQVAQIVQTSGGEGRTIAISISGPTPTQLQWTEAAITSVHMEDEPVRQLEIMGEE